MARTPRIGASWASVSASASALASQASAVWRRPACTSTNPSSGGR